MALDLPNAEGKTRIFNYRIVKVPFQKDWKAQKEKKIIKFSKFKLSLSFHYQVILKPNYFTPVHS